MKKELLTSIIALSSLHTPILMAQDIERIVLEKVEISQDIYLTLKTLTLLKSLRVDRETYTLKINLNILPSYLTNEINKGEDIEIDHETGEMVITESSIKLLTNNKYLKELSRSIIQNTTLESTFDNFLKQINKQNNFDLRDDLDRYSSHMFS